MQTKDSQVGTYVAVVFDEETKDKLAAYGVQNNIPNLLDKDHFHSTIAYSRKVLDRFEPHGKLEENWIGTPTDFDVFLFRPTGVSTRCLVLKFECENLDERHQYLKEVHGATHDYSTYESHITLSYDIGDMDIATLPNIKKWLDEIHIIREYSEALEP